MGNYEELKQAVSNVIKTNGNQEITGAIMQNTLLTIISTVGDNATFAGIATPETNPGTPDQNVFWLASCNGVYSNFDGIVISNEVAILVNKTNTWKKQNTGILSEMFIGYIRGYYVSRDGGKITSYPTLCYSEIQYSLGDEIIADGALSGQNYDKYNFFEDETFISSSNELSSIPGNCNKIKINGDVSVGITVTINGKGANLISQVEENKQGIEENKQGIEENKQGIDSLNLNIDGVIFGSYINRSGIKTSFPTLCYTEITYIDGDEIIADGALSGQSYDKYNFFEDETFISSSNELSSIPGNCNKIKINGDVSVGITVTINGKGANTYSKIKKLETEVEELGNEVESINSNITVLADTVSETANNVDNIISDESVKKQYVNLQDNVNVLSNIFNDSPNINYIPGVGYNMKATSVFGAKTKLPFNYTSGKRVALCATIFFNNVTDDFLFQFGFNSSGWDKSTRDIKASDYGLSNFTGTTQTFALIWDATKASNPYFFVYKSEVAPGQTEEYTIKNFAVVDMGSNAEENELYNLTAEQLVEIFKYSQVKGNDIQYKNLIVRIAEEAKNISLDAFLQKEKFYNKKLITIGDSLTANCIWQPRLCNLTGLLWSEDETKNGVGYVNKNTGEYTTEDKSSDPNYRKAYKMAIGGTGTRPTSVDSIYMRSFDAKFYNPEIILIYTGQNDPISTWKTSTNPGTTPYEIVENEVPYKDNEISSDVSVISAYRGMVENLMKDIPNAIIYLVTQMRVLGVVGMEQAGGGIRFNTQQDVVDWEFSDRYPKVEYIRAIGKLYGLPVIDLWDKSGITDYNSEYWYGEPASDCTQVHPEAIGYYRMADVMKQTM